MLCSTFTEYVLAFSIAAAARTLSSGIAARAGPPPSVLVGFGFRWIAARAVPRRVLGGSVPGADHVVDRAADSDCGERGGGLVRASFGGSREGFGGRGVGFRGPDTDRDERSRLRGTGSAVR